MAPAPTFTTASSSTTNKTSLLDSLNNKDQKKDNKYDVIIVGAGISGLAAAYYMSKHHPNKKIAILEARENIGGTWDYFKVSNSMQFNATQTSRYILLKQ